MQSLRPSRFVQLALGLPLVTVLACSSDNNTSPGSGSTGGSGGSGVASGTGGSGGSSAKGGSGGSGGAGGVAGTGGKAPDSGVKADGSSKPDAGRGDAGRSDGGGGGDASGTFALTLPWTNGGMIPAANGCPMTSWPALSWTAGPSGTMSYAFALHDNQYMTHYVIYNIPATVHSLPPIPAGGTKVGFANPTNTQWGGPCPPPGQPHHYVVSVYALRTATYNGPKNSGPNARDSLESPTNPDVLARSSIEGVFQR